MHTMWVLVLLLATTAAAQSPDYAPGPQPGLETNGLSPYSSAPAPTIPGLAPTPSYLAPVPVLAPSPNGFSPQQAPAPAPTPDLLTAGPATTNSSADAKWCAVRDEFEDCLTYTSQLSAPNLSWTCLLRESKGECMEAIQTGLANLMSLEAGLAYVAFLNHSMKAILAEEYTFHSQSYGAVAVVNKKMCDDNPNLKLDDLKHHKSCHSGYLSAAGWNYPVQALLNSVPLDSELLDDESLPNDVKVISSFFSASCAPSEVREGGICTGCGTGDNSSFCASTYNDYTGEDGAFRCLMDGRGDIAFLRAETPTLYSSDGLNNQTWSTKPVDEFMYLCPSGGCKAVNDNHGSCQFANVPANVIMTQNSLPETLKQAIITTLLAANWTESLYTGRNWQNYLLSVRCTSLFRKHCRGSSSNCLVRLSITKIGGFIETTPFTTTCNMCRPYMHKVLQDVHEYLTLDGYIFTHFRCFQALFRRGCSFQVSRPNIEDIKTHYNDGVRDDAELGMVEPANRLKRVPDTKESHIRTEVLDES